MKVRIDWKAETFRVLAVVISTIIYCIGVVWFLSPAKLYAGGVTGISQLIVNFWEVYISGKLGGFKLDLGIMIAILNVPILAYGWSGVSKRFAIYSIISIGLQTLLTSTWFTTKVIPTPDLGINVGDVQTLDRLLLAFVGGFICGIGAGAALRYGTSTGGIDVLAQAVAFKKNISIGYTGLIVNVIIAILAAILHKDYKTAFYTFVRIIVNTVVVDKVHTAYNYLRVEIITQANEDELQQELLDKIGRGITITHAEGAYTHANKDVLEIYVSSYELQNLLEIVQKKDEHAFITVVPAKMIIGNFKRKTIA